MTHAEAMDLALQRAREAFLAGEVPVGAVILGPQGLLSAHGNRRERDQQVLAHGELLALAEACAKQGSWRLPQCRIYITLEPCGMCTGAILQAGIKTLYFATRETGKKNHGSLTSFLQQYPSWGSRVTVEEGGSWALESQALLEKFFAEKRKQKKKF